MNNIQKDAIFHIISKTEDSCDIAVLGDEIIHGNYRNDCLEYRYHISFISEHEFASNLKNSIERIVVKTGAVTAMQLYDDITSYACNPKNFSNMFIEVILSYKNGNTRSRSFVTYEKGELCTVEYTNGFIGPNDDYGTWRLNRDGSWEFSRSAWKIAWNGTKILYYFEVTPNELRFPVTSIYDNVNGCMNEAKNALQKYFKI